MLIVIYGNLMVIYCDLLWFNGYKWWFLVILVIYGDLMDINGDLW